MEINGNGAYKIYDPKNKLVKETEKTSQGQKEHLLNFVEAVRANDSSKLNQPILSGYQSTLLVFARQHCPSD